MIPYIRVPSIPIAGPIKLHPFGILVATAVILGTSIAMRRARKIGYNVYALNSFITWMLVGGFLGGHVLDSIFYHWDEVVRRPISLLYIWEGLSSFGGFSGALVGILLWKFFDYQQGRGIVRIRKPRSIFAYVDLILSVFPVAWIIGRAGCSTVHDHPGARAAADSILAVGYPSERAEAAMAATKFEIIWGKFPRYDLGLLEMLFSIVLALAFALTWKRKLPIGTYIVATAFTYAPVRFALDFLRIPEREGGDTRHYGFTFAQWECIALLLFGVFALMYVVRLRREGIDLEKEALEPAKTKTPDLDDEVAEGS